jgi:hypothetical protein
MVQESCNEIDFHMGPTCSESLCSADNLGCMECKLTLSIIIIVCVFAINMIKPFLDSINQGLQVT